MSSYVRLDGPNVVVRTRLPQSALLLFIIWNKTLGLYTRKIFAASGLSVLLCVAAVGVIIKQVSSV